MNQRAALCFESISEFKAFTESHHKPLIEFTNKFRTCVLLSNEQNQTFLLSPDYNSVVFIHEILTCYLSSWKTDSGWVNIDQVLVSNQVSSFWWLEIDVWVNPSAVVQQHLSFWADNCEFYKLDEIGKLIL